MKKIAILLILIFTVLFVSSCSKKETLLFLNWGEYISDDLVSAFEDKYHVRVVVDIAESNELFYAKLKSGTTKYDLCCPSDYMIEKMYLNNLISEIEIDKLENYKDGIFMDEVYQIMNEMNDSMKDLKEDYENQDISKYHVPYFWGTFGLMYNKENPIFSDLDNNFKPDIFEEENAWKIYFFDESIDDKYKLPLDLRIGMYNVVRFSYAASMIYNMSNPNAILNEVNQNSFKEILSRRKYTLWGGDTLKHSIVADNLDLAFNYTGDCLDMAYVKIQDDGLNFEDLSFYTFTPEVTIAHIDSLVIPKGARHYDLALKFIDFMLDPVSEWINARNVGYCPPLQETYDMIVSSSTPDTNKYPYADFGKE